MRIGRDWKNPLVRNAGWNGMSQLTAAATTAVLTPELVRRLGISGYGVWAIGVAAMAMASNLNGGLPAAVLRFVAAARARDDHDATVRLATTALLVSLCLGVLVAGVIYLMAPELASAVHARGSLTPGAVGMFRLIGPTIAAGLVVGLCSSLMQAAQRFRSLALISASGQLTFVALVVWQVLLGNGGVRSLAGAALASSGVSCLGMLVAVRSSVSFRAPWLSRQEMLEVARFSLKTQFSGVTALINLEADTLVVGLVLSPRSAGIYAVGAMIASLVRTLPSWALPPIFADLSGAFGAGGPEAARARFGVLHPRWVNFLAVYGCVALGVSWFGTVAWMGISYRAAALVALLLSGGNLINLVSGTVSGLVRAFGRPGLEFRYAVVVTVLNLALTVPLAIWCGLVGVAIATAVAQIVGTLSFAAICSRDGALPAARWLARVDWPASALAGAVFLPLAWVVYRMVPHGLGGLTAVAAAAGASLAVGASRG